MSPFQSFDEVGRRIPAFSSTKATPLFSWLDDGAGHAAAESVLDVWMDEGVENGVEILQVRRSPGAGAAFVRIDPK